MIKINTDYAIDQKRFKEFENKIKIFHNQITNKTGKGSDFLGWLDLPSRYNTDEYKSMKIKAKYFRNEIDFLVVIGIGGSYLGSRAAIEMINGLYPKNEKVKIMYAGQSMSSTYTKQLLDFLSDKKFGICVISKSGNTIETAISFRFLEKLLISKIGDNKAKKLIVCITDESKGKLFNLANLKGYQKYIIPNDIAGWYPVLTPVGIFPMMVAGIDTEEIFSGAKKASIDLSKEYNSAYNYALTRYILYKENKYKVELLVSYELQMKFFTEWWRELFGESEGKENKGLLPTTSLFSTDLHSLGQFIQEGSKVLFETVITFKNCANDLKMFKLKEDLDELNYLENKTLNGINYIAQKGVLDAHKNSGNVPNIILEFDEMSAKNFGYAVYWFFKSCTMSSYLLGVNPNGLDQKGTRGVQVYKENINKLLK